MTFGADPKDYEVQEYIQKYHDELDNDAKRKYAIENEITKQELPKQEPPKQVIQ